jgi:acyl-CoA reductase-like NAD-dependent aldehyde dehydrogenase
VTAGTEPSLNTSPGSSPIVEATRRRAQTAQRTWAATPIPDRLLILRAARHRLSHMASDLCTAISPALARTGADTRIAEVLPLLDACLFLERNATRILATRRLGHRGLPFWLNGIQSAVHRAPFGQILVIGPANYPLFLPGVQALQALAAGNAVVWKPGREGRAVADLFSSALRDAGLPTGLLQVTDDSNAATQLALAGEINGLPPDKVFFTGSATTGRMILQQLATTATPSVMELSGCDAVIVLPSASIDRVARALAFGLRFNGSATCMAPRRVLLLDSTPDRRDQLVECLLAAIPWIKGVALDPRTAATLHDLIDAATAAGARLHGTIASPQQPLLLTGVTPAMPLAQSDLFAPVLSLIDCPGEPALLEAESLCPFALTVSIFGDEAAARTLAARLTAGTLLINDLIVPTVDPRLPFGGRRASGFGTTRGTEGLLEMTAPQTIVARRGNNTRHYDPADTRHEGLFDGMILTAHSPTWRQRWRGLNQIVASLRKGPF